MNTLQKSPWGTAFVPESTICSQQRLEQAQRAIQRPRLALYARLEADKRGGAKEATYTAAVSSATCLALSEWRKLGSTMTQLRCEQCCVASSCVASGPVDGTNTNIRIVYPSRDRTYINDSIRIVYPSRTVLTSTMAGWRGGVLSTVPSDGTVLRPRAVFLRVLFPFFPLICTYQNSIAAPSVLFYFGPVEAHLILVPAKKISFFHNQIPNSTLVK